MKKYYAWALVLAGLWYFWRSRTASVGNLLPGGTAGASPAGGGLTVGQIGSNFTESNSLADAVSGLVGGIWGNGGQGYGGNVSIKTADGTLNYYAPISLNQIIPGYNAGRFYYDP